MRVAVIGAGRIGGTLGKKWESAGHDVTYGLRDPAKKPGAKPFDAALEGADAVLLAIPGGAVVDFVRAHARALDGKVVLDATNNFSGGGPINAWGQIAPLIPEAQLYRAFNSYGVDVFVDPIVGGEQADLFYAGPEGKGKELAETLITDTGLRPVWVGDSDQVEVIDGALKLWFTLAQKRGRRLAFRLIAD